MSKTKERPSGIRRICRGLGWAFTLSPLYLLGLNASVAAWLPAVKPIVRHLFH